MIKGHIQIPSDVLTSLKYSNSEEAALDLLILETESKHTQFREEVTRFEEKYNMKFEEFQSKNNNRRNSEDFEEEDDLMSWKFAVESADYWKSKMSELDRAS